jgi:hypothetical protein
MGDEETRANIDVKQAVTIATAYIANLFPNAHSVRLEEAELVGETWNVVLSFPSDDPMSNSLVAMIAAAQNAPRLYKLVRIDRVTGQATALKVWKP